jgi:hypothetical protein
MIDLLCMRECRLFLAMISFVLPIYLRQLRVV